MGYHHCHIPTLDVCVKQYTLLGLDEFVKRYINCNILIGDSNAVIFIEEKIDVWLKIKSHLPN